MMVNDTRFRSPITYSYTLNGYTLIPVDSNICDLGFNCTSLLCPRNHIGKITFKTLKVFYSVKKISSDFKLNSSP